MQPRAPAANVGTFRFQRVLSPLHTQRLAPRFDNVALSPASQAANAARLAAHLAADAADAAADSAADLEALAAQEEVNSITSMSSHPPAQPSFLPVDDVGYTTERSEDVDLFTVPNTQEFDSGAARVFYDPEFESVSASMASACLYSSSVMQDSPVPTPASSDYHPTQQSVTRSVLLLFLVFWLCFLTGLLADWIINLHAEPELV